MQRWKFWLPALMGLVVLVLSSVPVARSQFDDQVANAAPTMAAEYKFVAIAGLTVISVPANTRFTGCVEASAAAVGAASGCNMGMLIDQTAPTVARTLRVIIPRAYPDPSASFDPTLETQVGQWFQRTGTGVVTPYMVLVSN